MSFVTRHWQLLLHHLLRPPVFHCPLVRECCEVEMGIGIRGSISWTVQLNLTIFHAGLDLRFQVLIPKHFAREAKLRPECTIIDHALLACILEIPSIVELATQWMCLPGGVVLVVVVEAHAWKELAELLNQIVTTGVAKERRWTLHSVIVPEAGRPARFDMAGSVDQEAAGEKVILAAGTRTELIEKFFETQLTHALERKVRFFVFVAGKVGLEADLVVWVLTHDEPFGECRNFSRHCVAMSVDDGRVGRRIAGWRSLMWVGAESVRQEAVQTEENEDERVRKARKVVNFVCAMRFCKNPFSCLSS